MKYTITGMLKAMNDNGLLMFLMVIFIAGFFMSAGLSMRSVGASLMLMTGWIGVVWAWKAIVKALKEVNE